MPYDRQRTAGRPLIPARLCGSPSALNRLNLAVQVPIACAIVRGDQLWPARGLVSQPDGTLPRAEGRRQPRALVRVAEEDPRLGSRGARSQFTQKYLPSRER